MIYKYTSVKEIVTKVMRDANIQDDNQVWDFIEWIAEGLDLIGTFEQHSKKFVEFELCDTFKYPVPCDLVSLVDISKSGSPLPYLTGTFDNFEAQKFESRFSTPGFVTHKMTTGSREGYTINGPWFNFNFNKGKIQVSYLGLLMDDEGYPLIPDIASVKEALSRYVMMKMAYPKFIGGTINPNVYAKLEDDWHWYCSQSVGKIQMPNRSQLNNIKNNWMRLRPMVSDSSYAYRFNGINSKVDGFTS